MALEDEREAFLLQERRDREARQAKEGAARQKLEADRIHIGRQLSHADEHAEELKHMIADNRKVFEAWPHRTDHEEHIDLLFESVITNPHPAEQSQLQLRDADGGQVVIEFDTPLTIEALDLLEAIGARNHDIVRKVNRRSTNGMCARQVVQMIAEAGAPHEITVQRHILAVFSTDSMKAYTVVKAGIGSAEEEHVMEAFHMTAEEWNVYHAQSAAIATEVPQMNQWNKNDPVDEEEGFQLAELLESAWASRAKQEEERRIEELRQRRLQAGAVHASEYQELVAQNPKFQKAWEERTDESQSLHLWFASVTAVQENEHRLGLSIIDTSCGFVSILFPEPISDEQFCLLDDLGIRRSHAMACDAAGTNNCLLICQV